MLFPTRGLPAQNFVAIDGRVWPEALEAIEQAFDCVAGTRPAIIRAEAVIPSPTGVARPISIPVGWVTAVDLGQPVRRDEPLSTPLQVAVGGRNSLAFG